MVTIEDQLTDLVPEILSCLPVKSLMRFQFVHKSWYHLIKSQCFITKHLQTCSRKKSSSRNKSSSNCSFNHIIVKNFRSKLSNDLLVSLLYLDKETDILMLHYLKLFKISAKVTNLEICGPCNGVYFIHNNERLNTDHSVLINPSRREFRSVPRLDFPKAGMYFSVYPGLGFDHKTNDYKVIFILTKLIQTHLYFRHVVIYSLNSNSWREIQSPVPSFSSAGRKSNVFAHGVFHRSASDGDGDSIILGFDMVEEVFKKIKLPKMGDLSWDVIRYKDSIGAVACHISFPYGRNFEIWIMKEYGNEGSWIRYLSVDKTQGIERILGLWKDEEDEEFLMLDNQHNMVLYNLKSQSFRTVGINVGIGYKQATFYMESLVSLRREDEQGQTQVSFLDVRPQRPKRKLQGQKRKRPFLPDNRMLKRVRY